MLQFHRLTFKQGVLHCLYINSDVEYHQMILPIKYQVQVLMTLSSNDLKTLRSLEERVMASPEPSRRPSTLE